MVPAKINRNDAIGYAILAVLAFVAFLIIRAEIRKGRRRSAARVDVDFDLLPQEREYYRSIANRLYNSFVNDFWQHSFDAKRSAVEELMSLTDEEIRMVSNEYTRLDPGNTILSRLQSEWFGWTSIDEVAAKKLQSLGLS